jgi:hypothetical protein
MLTFYEIWRQHLFLKSPNYILHSTLYVCALYVLHLSLKSPNHILHSTFCVCALCMHFLSLHFLSM